MTLQRVCVVFCVLFACMMLDMLMTCWVNVSCCSAYNVCPIGTANWAQGLLWPECGECYSAAAVLVSRLIWRTCVVNQACMFMMHLIYFVTVDISQHKYLVYFSLINCIILYLDFYCSTW